MASPDRPAAIEWQADALRAFAHPFLMSDLASRFKFGDPLVHRADDGPEVLGLNGNLPHHLADLHEV